MVIMNTRLYRRTLVCNEHSVITNTRLQRTNFENITTKINLVTMNPSNNEQIWSVELFAITEFDYIYFGATLHSSYFAHDILIEKIFHR